MKVDVTMSVDGKWLIPFKGRNPSGTFDCNFLWQKDQLYVMDNHRLALWCWLRHLEENETINIVHIDQHYDCLYDECWVKALPQNLETMPLVDYMNFSYQYPQYPVPLFRFDNYLSLFLERYRNQVSDLYVSTHRDGEKPRFKFEEFTVFESLGYLNARCNDSDSVKTIVNFDIDYFTDSIFDENAFVVVSDDYLKKTGSLLRKGLDNGAIRCLTVALSPEYVDSWDMAETLADKLFRAMGIEFHLP